MKGTRTVSLLLAGMLGAALPLQAQSAGMPRLKLTTEAFTEGGSIPSRFTCQGRETSPPLAIEGVPGEAKSLALIVDDPDAPGGTWTHWLVWNIDPGTSRIWEGSVPRGAEQGMNSRQRQGYDAPCPPSGQHRYYFRIYALSQRLTLPPKSARADLERAMEGKVLAQGELMGVYRKK